MKILLLNTLIFILLISQRTYPQQYSINSPEWLVDMFFNKSSFPDKANYFTGEMEKESDKKTIGEELNGKGKISFHRIKATNSTSVFAIEVASNNDTTDFYCYLVRDYDQWKIYAVKRFLLPTFLYSVRDSLSNIKTLSASDSAFLFSLRLVTDSDSELKNYLKSNLEKFQELILSFNNNEKDKVNRLLASIGCNAIYNDKNYPGCSFVRILKIENMEAGFIFAIDSAVLPSVSTEEFIYLDEVVPDWFVYRIKKE